jgi:hypothetical protein
MPHAPSLSETAAPPRRDNRNLADRITEARMNNWLGEVPGLQASLTKAKEKLASLDRGQERSQRNGPVNLGMPIITDPR